MQSPQKFLVGVVSQSFKEVIRIVQKLGFFSAACQMGLGFHSSAIDNVDHDTLWLAVLSEFRQPGSTRAPAPGGIHHMEKMKNCAIVGNFGHFGNEIVEGSEAGVSTTSRLKLDRLVSLMVMA